MRSSNILCYNSSVISGSVFVTGDGVWPGSWRKSCGRWRSRKAPGSRLCLARAPRGPTSTSRKHRYTTDYYTPHTLLHITHYYTSRILLHITHITTHHYTLYTSHTILHFTHIEFLKKNYYLKCGFASINYSLLKRIEFQGCKT